MIVKVRTIDGNVEESIEISKLMEIKEFKLEIATKFSMNIADIRLFYRGKQLENGYRICHYELNHHDVVQLFVISKNNMPIIDQLPDQSTTKNKIGCSTIISKSEQSNNLIEAKSPLYRIGDLIDCIDRSYGAWFEAIIKQIFVNKDDNSFVYRVQWQFLIDEEPFNVIKNMIRPRARNRLDIQKIQLGQRVMVNYNTENPKKIGYWYDFTIEKIKKIKLGIQLVGTLHIASDETVINNCKIDVKNGIYKIEEPKVNSSPDSIDIHYLEEKIEQRKIAIICEACNDNRNEKCDECGCCVCSEKRNPHLIILCDECDKAYHITCLTPALEEVPEDDWYCPECKTDVDQVIKVGERLPEKKKKIKVELKKGQKDWGRGMGCMGRVRECTIVPPNHRGEVPGIEVGMSWKYRLQVSEAGVHRPHVAGIHGRESECAYSLVLSGGYEDDVDNGDEFIYTGSGGRDLSGNKRTAAQSSDQTLTKMNKALALNCKAKFNDIIGAAAENWRDGIPVRVVRSAKMRKHSQSHKYAPEQGFRYDGIYKVCKYFPEKGKSGFTVWRFILRRDDEIPAPWTAEGKKRIESLGIEMIDYEFPYANGNKKENSKQLVTGVKRTKKQKNIEQLVEVKRRKIIEYKLDKDLLQLIKNDDMNMRLWNECQSFLSQGKIAFINNVTDRFTCVCCREIVWKPITMPCLHNICNYCLNRSLKADVHTCPVCRCPLKKSQSMSINESLSLVLEKLFPGYGAGRF
ncbi:hypothetical protein PV326_008360 [Microctonus aethiopoides]|nr:hypothetical protein PV326_008360 [Microctonus aethiopoides]